MKITFCGAAGIVTGSCYLLESGNDKILVDCGMFQGSKEINRLNYSQFPFNAHEINSVVLTHAHIDHSGLLPLLAKQGFNGRIICTPATEDLAKIMLEDSANIQFFETKSENKRRARENLEPREPLYSLEDAKKCNPLFSRVNYNKEFQITQNIKVKFRDAGHIVGSAIAELFINEDETEKKIVFSGDLGQWNVPLVNDPTIIEDADFLLIESTYGNRLHEEPERRDDILLGHIIEAYKKGGKLLIPSFAIERTQELLYSLANLEAKNALPNENIYLDSPLAIKATEIMKNHVGILDDEARKKRHHLFTVKNLIYTEKVEESKKINDLGKPCIVIAGSGMCTAGRIRHHLRHGLDDEKNTVLFVGWQAEGTLGRIILEGAKNVRMMGLSIPVNAEVRKMNSFSAHADYNDLMKWARGFIRKPKRTFIVHGEVDSSEALKERLEKEGFECHIPKMLETVDL